jgi:hypothetical protein
MESTSAASTPKLPRFHSQSSVLSLALDKALPGQERYAANSMELMQAKIDHLGTKFPSYFSYFLLCRFFKRFSRFI